MSQDKKIAIHYNMKKGTIAMSDKSGEKE